HTELEIAALRDLESIVERLGQLGEELAHRAGGLQVLLRRVIARTGRVVERAALRDADAHLVRIEVVGLEEAHLVRRDERQPFAGRELDGPLEVFGLAGPAEALA